MCPFNKRTFPAYQVGKARATIRAVTIKPYPIRTESKSFYTMYL